MRQPLQNMPQVIGMSDHFGDLFFLLVVSASFKNDVAFAF